MVTEGKDSSFLIERNCYLIAMTKGGRSFEAR